MEIGIHHLSTETLEDWGLDLETQTISLDSVTSDGIRMFDSEMDVDADQIDATYRDGVLLVTIPKAPRVAAKRIEVQR